MPPLLDETRMLTELRFRRVLSEPPTRPLMIYLNSVVPTPVRIGVTVSLPQLSAMPCGTCPWKHTIDLFMTLPTPVGARGALELTPEKWLMTPTRRARLPPTLLMVFRLMLRECRHLTYFRSDEAGAFSRRVALPVRLTYMWPRLLRPDEWKVTNFSTTKVATIRTRMHGKQQSDPSSVEWLQKTTRQRLPDY